MIELRNVTKRFKKQKKWHYAIRDANIRAGKGDRIALLGIAGSGKTTILRLMCGTESPDSGEIIRSSHASWPIPLTSGFSTQLSGAVNARFIARLFDQEPESYVRRVQAMSELGDRMNEPLNKLSSKARSQFAFSVGVCTDFDLYLFDESVLVGSQAFKKKCSDIVSNLGKERGLFIATNSRSYLKTFCNQAYVLDDGNVFYYANIREAWLHLKELVMRQPIAGDIRDENEEEVVSDDDSSAALDGGI